MRRRHERECWTIKQIMAAYPYHESTVRKILTYEMRGNLVLPAA